MMSCHRRTPKLYMSEDGLKGWPHMTSGACICQQNKLAAMQGCSCLSLRELHHMLTLTCMTFVLQCLELLSQSLRVHRLTDRQGSSSQSASPNLIGRSLLTRSCVQPSESGSSGQAHRPSKWTNIRFRSHVVVVHEAFKPRIAEQHLLVAAQQHCRSQEHSRLSPPPLSHA